MNDSHNNRVTIRVWGDFACFTRPEMKVERVSYPVITPSAARGVLEAIYWEPQMYYIIDRIHIIKRGHWISIRRNEVTSVISLDNAASWMNGTKEVSPIQAGGGAKDGTQRNTLALQDVEYLITAEIRLTNLAQPPRDNLGKYFNKIQKRARSGKCFHRPCLGVREFAAYFDLVENADIEKVFAQRHATAGDAAAKISHEPLGLMLYDVFDPRQRERGFRWLHDAAWVENFKRKRPNDELVVKDEFPEHKERFEATISGLKKSEQNKRRKEYTNGATHFFGAKIQPRAAFFQAEINNNIMLCHPDADNFKILTQTLEG